MQELSASSSCNYLEIIFYITWRTHDLGAPARATGWVPVLVPHPHTFPGWRELLSRVLLWMRPSWAAGWDYANPCVDIGDLCALSLVFKTLKRTKNLKSIGNLQELC